MKKKEIRKRQHLVNKTTALHRGRAAGRGANGESGGHGEKVAKKRGLPTSLGLGNGSKRK